jgi:hypothetical protein
MSDADASTFVPRRKGEQQGPDAGDVGPLSFVVFFPLFREDDAVHMGASLRDQSTTYPDRRPARI